MSGDHSKPPPPTPPGEYRQLLDYEARARAQLEFEVIGHGVSIKDLTYELRELRGKQQAHAHFAHDRFAEIDGKIDQVLKKLDLLLKVAT